MAEASMARILVANDDGIDAPGIKLLEKIARELSPEVWVVAPEQEQSGAGHSLTTRRPIHLTEVGPRRYVVEATVTGDDDTQIRSTQHVVAAPPFVLGMKVPRYLPQAGAIEGFDAKIKPLRSRSPGAARPFRKRWRAATTAAPRRPRAPGMIPVSRQGRSRS